MSLVDSFESNLLKLLFQNIALASVGDVAGVLPSAAPGNIYVALHTADPLDAMANQGVSEMTYTGYARQAAVRSAAGWAVTVSTTNVADNAALIQMGLNTSTSETATDFSLGFAVSGATVVYMIGTADLVVSNNVNPEFAIGALDVSLD